MQIIGIDHVVIRCVDVERMLEFYCDVIGCTIDRRRDELGLYHLRAGRSLVDLVSVAGKAGRQSGGTPEKHARNMDHFCLRIDSFDEPAIRAHFAANGIELGQVQNNYGAEGDGPSFYICDPEGNTIELKGPAGNTYGS
jgi:catechol 2,3-dioxygenase-like lactoylglutathione lyase family enzyme